MYDTFSIDYDRFVNWPARLGAELPFIEGQLGAVADGRTDALEVLDSACGTGMHAIALAQRGYTAAGADVSAPMIERARANAGVSAVPVRFETAGFGELAEAFGRRAFDALLCLGNSLPHLLTNRELATALDDFATCLRPGGLLLIQNRNFDAVLAGRERWMEPQAHREDETEWLFLRFYDFEPDGLITFNVLTLRREGTGPWTQRVTSTRLRPLRQADVMLALGAAGFTDVSCYGDMAGAAFNTETSGNLVVTARLPAARRG
jgi:glycine/sarcosine N-methyltransferase